MQEPSIIGIPRPRFLAIASLSLPIIGGMTSQTILNLVDTLMVSRLGAAAVAAVGLGGVANFMASSFITGLSAGVQAMVARRSGAGKHDETAVPLNGGLLMVGALAIPLSFVLIWFTGDLLAVLADDPEVVAHGVPYLQARLAGMVAVGANFAFRGYWNGVSMSRMYMRTLVLMHVSNVVISYVLIFGHLGLPALGARGAGLGTTISTFLGTGYYVILGLRHARAGGFLKALPSVETMRTVVRLSLPSGLQRLLYATGMTLLFGIVGKVGTTELAAANILLNVYLVAFLPGLGLGLSAASLVGQALGKGDVEDAARWGWDVVRVAVVVMGVLGMPMLLVPELIISAFFEPGTAEAAVAVWPMRIAGVITIFEGVGTVLFNSIMGAGATKLTMKIAIGLQWGVFLPTALVVGPVLGGGLVAIWLVNAGYRFLLTMACVEVWRRRWWVGIDA